MLAMVAWFLVEVVEREGKLVFVIEAKKISGCAA